MGGAQFEPTMEQPPTARATTWSARIVAGIVMAAAAATPGWFLWKHYPPLLIVFLLCGALLGGWLVGGAIGRGRNLARVAANGAAAALLSFPIVGFAVGLGMDCVGRALAADCLSIERGLDEMTALIVAEAPKSVLPVAFLGALAALAAAFLFRRFFFQRPESEEAGR